MMPKIITGVVLIAVIGGGAVWYLGRNKPNQNSNINSQASANTKTDASCKTAALTASLMNAKGGGAAGTYYYNLVLKNIGGEPCTMSGAPQVLARGADGAGIGQTIASTAASGTLSLEPGDQVYASIGFPSASNFPDGVCKPMKSLLVYPPHQTSALTIDNIDTYNAAYTSQYCQPFSVTDISATAL